MNVGLTSQDHTGLVLSKQLKNLFASSLPNVKQQKPCIAAVVGQTMVKPSWNMNVMRSEPSGKRSAHFIAARPSSGSQVSGKGIPQLIPDGLTPGGHVIVAMMTCHPLQLAPTFFPPLLMLPKMVPRAVSNAISNKHKCLLH